MSTARCAHSLRSDVVARRMRRTVMAVVLLLALALLAGCSAQAGQTAGKRTANVAATQTAGAAATRVAEPVLVEVSAQEEGALAAHTAKLIVAVTVTNQTTAPIHLYRIPCYGPFFDLHLKDSQGAMSGNLDLEDPCLLGLPPTDKEPAIAAGDAYTFTVTVALKYYPTLSPGPYALVAKVQWHQRSLDQLSAGQADILQGTAQGTGAITLQ